MNSLIATIVSGVLMMFAGFTLRDKKAAVTMAQVLLVVVLGVNIWDLINVPDGIVVPLFNDMIRFERPTLIFNMLMTGCTLVYALLLGRETIRVGMHVADYFALIFFILTGTYLLSSFNNLLMLFLGIEILSIPQYILAGVDKRNLKSSEASLKYFLMGSFSTGILLMGITLLYGAAGSFNVFQLNFLNEAGVNVMGLAGLLLLLVAMSFKVSAAPFHIWTPDVYDGAPTPFTAYMATVGKAAAFYGFIRLFQGSFAQLSSRWVLVLSLITALTLLIGNLTAVFQQSVKRMLAYSSIAQAGFMLFAVMSVSDIGRQGILLYAVTYTLATIGLFAVLIKLKDYTYDGFNGLAKTHPFLAFAATIFLFSLAGIPLTGGFMAKYWVLRAAVEQGNLMWLVIFALLMAAVSAYYYFRVIIAMYFKEGKPEFKSDVSGMHLFMLGVTCALVILLGIMPQVLFF
jgi:NADH-quinone oxidoreductase subunit N